MNNFVKTIGTRAVSMGSDTFGVVVVGIKYFLQTATAQQQTTFLFPTFSKRDLLGLPSW